jgi:hypothetical protein
MSQCNATQLRRLPLALQSASTAVSFTGFGVSVSEVQQLVDQLYLYKQNAIAGDLGYHCLVQLEQKQMDHTCHLCRCLCGSLWRCAPTSNRSENFRPRDALYRDLWLPRPILTHVILKLPRTLPTVDGRWSALAAYSVAAMQGRHVLKH